MSSLKKTVLLSQESKRQGEIWHAALTSQQVTVIWEAGETDVLSVLQQMQTAGLALPDLLILDLGTQRFNPYGLCRTCREDYPGLKLVLTAGTQTDVDPVERRWAIFQGAQDLLPGIQAANLITGVIANLGRVLEMLGLKFNQEALMSVLKLLATLDSQNQEAGASSQATEVSPNSPQTAPAAESAPSGQYRGAANFEDPFTPIPPTPGTPTQRRYRGSTY